MVEEEEFDPFGLRQTTSNRRRRAGDDGGGGEHASEDFLAPRVNSCDVISTSKKFDTINSSFLDSPTGIVPTPVTKISPSSLDESVFDPFGLAFNKASSSSTRKGSISPPPEVSRVNRKKLSTAAASASPSKTSASASSLGQPSSSTTIVLPPKLVVKLSIHEEVASLAMVSGGPSCEGSSEVAIEGTIVAQVQSSDAKKNAPFVLMGSSANSSNTNNSQSSNMLRFLPDHRLSHPLSQQGTTSNNTKNVNGMLIQVPKGEIGFAPVGHYVITEQVAHMPILLERKVTMHKTNIKIAVQVRSKLSNVGDMEDFTIAVAVPEHVDGQSVRVVRGDGKWDDLKRIIKWRLSSLKKGESYMVTAQAKLWKPADTDATPINFPVLLRCSAPADQVSTVDLQVIQADGHPASLTVTKTSSFRMLHRLA